MRPQANVCTKSQWLPVARSHAHSVRTRENLWRTIGSERSRTELASAACGAGRGQKRSGVTPPTCSYEREGRASGGEGLVVGGVEFFVGAGAGDGHAGGAFGVEVERGAPTVGEFAGFVDRGVVGRDEREAERVLTGESGGDFGVEAEGIAGAGKVGAESFEDDSDEAEADDKLKG